MGKQIQFHMLSDDLQDFLDFVQSQAPVIVTVKSSDSPIVEAIPAASTESRVMTLWNQTLLGSLERKEIANPNGIYYRVDDSLPTLELSPSRLSEWGGKPALLQGRVYGFFDKPTDGYEEWYKSTAQWIRKNSVKNPFKLLGGYIGKSAFKWFQNGGILLPMFEPPPTSAWTSFVDAEHSTQPLAS